MLPALIRRLHGTQPRGFLSRTLGPRRAKTGAEEGGGAEIEAEGEGEEEAKPETKSDSEAEEDSDAEAKDEAESERKDDVEMKSEIEEKAQMEGEIDSSDTEDKDRESPAPVHVEDKSAKTMTNFGDAASPSEGDDSNSSSSSLSSTSSSDSGASNSSSASSSSSSSDSHSSASSSDHGQSDAQAAKADDVSAQQEASESAEAETEDELVTDAKGGSDRKTKNLEKAEEDDESCVTTRGSPVTAKKSDEADKTLEDKKDAVVDNEENKVVEAKQGSVVEDKKVAVPEMRKTHAVENKKASVVQDKKASGDKCKQASLTADKNLIEEKDAREKEDEKPKEVKKSKNAVCTQDNKSMQDVEKKQEKEQEEGKEQEQEIEQEEEKEERKEKEKNKDKKEQNKQVEDKIKLKEKEKKEGKDVRPPESGTKPDREVVKESASSKPLAASASSEPSTETEASSSKEPALLARIKQEPMDVEEEESAGEEEEEAATDTTVNARGAKAEAAAGRMGLRHSHREHETPEGDLDRDASPASLPDKDGSVLPSYLYPSVTITVENDKRVETSGPPALPSVASGPHGASTQGDGTINIEEVKASVGLPSAISLSVINTSGGSSSSSSSNSGKESGATGPLAGTTTSEASAPSTTGGSDTERRAVPTIVSTPTGYTVTAHNGLQISTQPVSSQTASGQPEGGVTAAPVRGRARKSFPNRPHPQVKITQSLANGPGIGGKGPGAGGAVGSGRRASTDSRRASFGSLSGDVTAASDGGSSGRGGIGIPNGDTPMVFIPPSVPRSASLLNGPTPLVNGEHSSSARAGAAGIVHHQAVTQAGGRLLPQLQPRPGPQQGGGPHAKYNGTVPAEAGPISQEIAKHAQKLAGYMQQVVEDVLRDMSNAGNLEASTKMLQLELEKVHWRYQQEIAELKHNTDLLLVEMRASMMSEQQRAVAEAVRQCEIEKQRAIEETKKKQWCTNCGKEALFYCCWNTSYCDYPCQQRHWPQHMASCGQAESMKAREAAENGIPQGAGPAAALVHHAPASKGYASGPQMTVPSGVAAPGKGVAPTGVQPHRPRGPTPPYGLMPMPRPPMQVVGRAQPASSTTTGIVASSNTTTTTSTSATTSCVAFVHTPVNSGTSPVILCHVSGRAATGGTCVATTAAPSGTAARVAVSGAGATAGTPPRPPGSSSGAGTGATTPGPRAVRPAATTLLHLRPVVAAPVVRLPLP